MCLKINISRLLFYGAKIYKKFENPKSFNIFYILFFLIVIFMRLFLESIKDLLKYRDKHIVGDFLAVIKREVKCSTCHGQSHQYVQCHGGYNDWRRTDTYSFSHCPYQRHQYRLFALNLYQTAMGSHH